MACRYSEAKGPVDFSGYWRVAKTEQFDGFLQDLGLPWVLRKAALKFAGNAIDVISHVGSVMRVTSLNAKGSWTRSYDTDRELMQRNAEGVMCKTTAWWEGRVFHTRLEGSPLGLCESWRYIRNGIMVVKTSVRLASGHEATMFWYFEMMEVLHRHLGRQGRDHLLRRIEKDQRQVAKATANDNAYLQKVLLDWDRWSSPADEFIQVVVSPSYSRTRLKHLSGAGSPHASQGNLSKSPSVSSLGSPLDMRSEGRSGPRSDIGSRSRLGSESTSALDRASVADLAKADKMVAAAAAAAAAAGGGGMPPRAPVHPLGAAAALSEGGPSNGSAVNSGTASPTSGAPWGSVGLPGPRVAAGGAGAAEQQAGQQQQRQREVTREISLSIRPAEGEEAAALPPPTTVLRPLRARPSQDGSSGNGGGDAGGVTFHTVDSGGAPASPTSLKAMGSFAGRVAGTAGATLGASGPSVTTEGPGTAAPSDMATVGSGSGGTAADAADVAPQTQHVRVASAGSLSGAAGSGSARAAQHRKEFSGEGFSDGRPSLRPTPRSSPPLSHRQMPTNGEQMLAFKAQEYLDARGIAAVVPVATPNDTSEPQLLCMSPEQAEQTHAKLRELEEEMLLQRQEYRRGRTCCCCFVVSWASSTLPDHLRTWEMSLS